MITGCCLSMPRTNITRGEVVPIKALKEIGISMLVALLVGACSIVLVPHLSFLQYRRIDVLFCIGDLGQTFHHSENISPLKAIHSYILGLGASIQDEG